MIPVTKTEKSILVCIKRWRTEYDNSPGVSDIAREIGKSYSTVYMALLKLEHKNYIELFKEYRRLIIKVLAYE